MMGMLVSGVSKDILKISTKEFTLYIIGFGPGQTASESIPILFIIIELTDRK